MMAFHMSTLSSLRIRVIGALSCNFHTTGVRVKVRNIFGAASCLSLGKSLAEASPIKCPKARGDIHIAIANRVEKFSTTTAVPRSFKGQSDGGGGAFPPRGQKRSSVYRRLALCALGVTAGVASLRTGARVSMAAGCEEPLKIDLTKGDWRKVKGAQLAMSVEERRKHYRTNYLALEDVPVWTPTPGSSGEPHFKRNERLDQKISLFSGDITTLEIDGIVNAANKTLLGGGGVDGAIHRAAGPLLKRECSELGGCETGQAKLTGGYGLPAKYVIHTVGPVAVGGVGEEERSRLRDCYSHSLEEAARGQLRTVAFPCISTGVYGYPPEQAVDVALATVRQYLDDHPDKLDRVIFCVFLPTDKELYQKRLPLYFPVGPPVKSKL